MLLFRAEEHIDRWCAQWNHTRGATLTIGQGWQLARAWYQHKMDAEWKRPALEEAEAILAGLGLHDSFWSLR